VLLQFVADHYPPWAVGLLAGTVTLLALVPGSILLLAAATIFGRNVVLPLRPQLGDAAQVWVARGAMVAFAAIAVWLTLTSNDSLVAIGLSAYAAVGMLAPGVFLGFLWPRANAAGVLAGLVAGYGTLLLPAARTLVSAALPGWDNGLVAMGVNALVVLLVSATVPASQRSTLAETAHKGT
jgi:solute:Na+ symporter, SSS family